MDEREKEIRRYSEDPGFRSDEHILKKEDALFLLSEIDRLKKENKGLREAVEEVLSNWIRFDGYIEHPSIRKLEQAYEKGER